MFTKDDIIFEYTRKEAISDGVLIDVTTTAREAGFSIPVALTAAAWAESVTVTPGLEGQDEAGRLWDVLNMLRFAIKQNQSFDSEIRFQLSVLKSGGGKAPALIQLKAICGPDDDANACITIMLPDED